MKITKHWLTKKAACEAGVDWFEKQKTNDFDKLFELAIKGKRYSDINWVLTKKMNKKQLVEYSIFAAEQVLKNYEKEHQNDDRVRKAIEAAKEYLKRPSKKTKSAAMSAAWSAWSAAESARSATSAARSAMSAESAESAAMSATSATSAAESAAWSAWSAAWSAWSAESAAESAAWSAWSAWSAAESAVYSDIVTHGYKMLIKGS